MINSADDANCSWVIEPHPVTFFAPDRPVDGTTVFAVDDADEQGEPGRGQVLLPP